MRSITASGIEYGVVCVLLNAREVLRGLCARARAPRKSALLRLQDERADM